MKALKFFLKAIGFASYAFMLFFSWFFGLLALCLLVIAIIDGDGLGYVASVAAAFISGLCWTIRKDGMV